MKSESVKNDIETLEDNVRKKIEIMGQSYFCRRFNHDIGYVSKFMSHKKKWSVKKLLQISKALEI